MLNQIRNALDGEDALRHVATAGAGLNMFAIGIVMSLIKPMPVFAATMGWFASGLFVGIAAIAACVDDTSRSERFSILCYRASIGLTAASLVLFTGGIIDWIGAS